MAPAQYTEQHRDQVSPALECLVVIVAVLLPFQALYVHCFWQIHYLSVFLLMLLFVWLKQNYNMKGKPPGSTLLFFYAILVGH